MSTRLSRGRSTPAIRANACLLPLPLLMPRVRADHADRAAPADHLAPIADLLHRRPHLHAFSLGLPLRCLSPSLTCSGKRYGRATSRTATAPRAPGPPGG